ncbi:MAG: hypothetical protein GXP54_03570, partial [Deltaproteobacteria bacterium]|nr:hypothetical protein [Deltaproteobacteria bacterium]
MAIFGKAVRSSLPGIVAAVLVMQSPPVLAGNRGVEEIAKQAEKDAGAARYEDAIQGFLKAWDMSGAPKYLYNVSILYLARVRDPLKAWEYAMRFRDASKSRRDLDDAAKLIHKAENELFKRYGKIEVDVRPSNAEAWLDFRS